MNSYIKNDCQIGEVRHQCQANNITNIHQIAEAYQKQKEQQLHTETLCYEMITQNGSDATGEMQHYSTKSKQEMIIWSINHYLALNRHPKVIASAKKALERYGTGCGTSAVSGGHNTLHKMLEERLAKLFEKERAMLFTTGYSANIGAISALAKGKNSLVLVDREAHASIIDGCRLAGSKYLPFRHNSVEDLERKLKRYASKYDNVFVVVESVYSMSGNHAPLKEFVILRQKYGFLLFVDEAHSFGIYGKNGAGRCQQLGILNEVDFIMTTLSKSTASLGGVIAAKKELITLIQSQSNAYLFQATLSPADVATVLSALEVIEDKRDIVEQLWEKTYYFRKRLLELGFDTGLGESPIISIYIRDTVLLLLLGKELLAQGVFTTSVTYPAVHRNESRFRFIVNASHTKEHIDRTLNVLEVLGRKYELI